MLPVRDVMHLSALSLFLIFIAVMADALCNPREHQLSLEQQHQQQLANLADDVVSIMDNTWY